jgi:hypothetical protein
VWHVDDIKISHVDKSVVDDVIQQLEDAFGNKTPISKSGGKIHHYLDMILDYSKMNKLGINHGPICQDGIEFNLR